MMILRSRPLLVYPQVMESLIRDLMLTHSWCLKWHMRLNPKKNKSMVVKWSRNYAPGYLTHGGAKLEDVKSLRILRILGITLDSKLTFETLFLEVVSNTAKNLEVVRRASKLFDCPRVLKRCFNACILSTVVYCAPVWMLSAESHLNLLDGSVCSVERLCEGELCCLGHRRKVSALRFLY